MRHPGENIDEICPYVPILDVPVPQMGWRSCGSSTCRLWSRLSQFPRSLLTGSHSVLPFRRPQKAEQLVEVPTEPGYALAVIATKAQQRHWPSRPVTLQFLKVGGGRGGGLQGSRARQNSTAADVEQIVGFPARRGLQGFPQARVPDCLTTQMKEFKGFFSLFCPAQKKNAEVTRQSSARVLGSVSSSELSSHQTAPVGESDGSEEDEAGDALSAAYAAFRRLRRRRGEGRGVGE